MTSPPRRLLFWDFLGRRSYEDALGLQLRLREAIRRGEGSEHFLLLEHPHVFTLGRNARPEDVLASPAWLLSAEVEVHECDRGGQVTYHGPGQLVGHPIVNLSPDRRDIRRFVRDLQEVLIRTLEHYGIVAERREGKDFIGLWVGTAKIASIGVHLSRWISTHGFALNLSTDLSFFRGIVPCGLTGVEMTSAEAVSGRRLPLAEVASVCARIFAEVFDRDLVRGVRGPAVEAPHRPDVLAVR